jgi:phosphoribosylformylglycinamidine synthase
VDFGHWPERLDQILFNESQSRVIISVRSEDTVAIEAMCTAAEIQFGRVGEVGGSELIVSTQRETLRWDIAELYQAWYSSIERAMSSQ